MFDSKDISFYNGFITLSNNLCNSTIKSSYTYSPSLPSRDCDFVLKLRWKIADDCSTNYADIEQTAYIEPRELPYSPLHMQQQVELRPWFQWSVLKDSASYRVFVRGDSDESERREITPRGGLKSNKLRLDHNLDQDSVFYWNVEYYNARQEFIKLSPSFEFKTRLMADLSLQEVLTPVDIFPGEDILGMFFLYSSFSFKKTFEIRKLEYYSFQLLLD